MIIKSRILSGVNRQNIHNFVTSMSKIIFTVQSVRENKLYL